MAFLGLGLGALLTGLQYAPVLLNAGVSAYNAVTGGVNAAAAAAPQIGAAVDTGR